nr:MAG TPA: hypothetical protein [Caudoviricetes sp.]
MKSNANPPQNNKNRAFYSTSFKAPSRPVERF